MRGGDALVRTHVAAVIAQNKWRAWRRKNKLDADCHEDFANQLVDVLEFVDPIFTQSVPDEATWDPNAYR